MAVRALALNGSREQLEAHRAALDVPEQGKYYDRKTVVEGRVLVDQIRLADWQRGTRYLELAPARLSDRAAARTLAGLFKVDPGVHRAAEMVELRRYAITGDYRAYEEWEEQQASA
ncbi:hypothetical protein [Streptomyces sp. NBC_01244]|uniref:hypothetical protein n=1 Tax=Streptomyces sp. NBC_01244 TaxID=2903797 RepID=UPI002E10F0C8|nr:hypothetical protein OG247_43850 [Streptomyces sp. NBC_01244]